MGSNTKFKPPRCSVQRAACGDGVGRRAWLHDDCWTPWRERRRAKAEENLVHLGMANHHTIERSL
jgi:hypothetical protein